MGWHPAPDHFPGRNPVIAGVSMGVLSVEGKPESGWLVTARLATEFGREGFGLAGMATEDLSFAPNQLLQRGAKPVTSPEEVIEQLPTAVRAALVQALPVEAEQRNLLLREGLTDSER